MHGRPARHHGAATADKERARERARRRSIRTACSVPDSASRDVGVLEAGGPPQSRPAGANATMGTALDWHRTHDTQRRAGAVEREPSQSGELHHIAPLTAAAGRPCRSRRAPFTLIGGITRQVQSRGRSLGTGSVVVGERGLIGYMQASMDKFSCAATKAPSACIVGAGMTPWS